MEKFARNLNLPVIVTVIKVRRLEELGHVGLDGERSEKRELKVKGGKKETPRS
jgi:hypothetical protein